MNSSLRLPFLLGLLALAPSPQEEGSVPFDTRSGFEPRALEAAPIRAQLGGAPGNEPTRIVLNALGDVRGLRVADLGDGHGPYLEELARRVGPEGRLVVGASGEPRRNALRALAEREELDTLEVVLLRGDELALEPDSIDLVLFADADPFPENGGTGSGHPRLLSLQRAIVPGGELIVTRLGSPEPSRGGLDRATRNELVAYGFEPGRRWIVSGSSGPRHVLEFRVPNSGLFASGRYMGREIARTMHWSGGGWLLRKEREREESAQEMLAALDVRPGQTLADLGCGNGYHTLELARMSAPGGRVYGVDIQPEMLAALKRRAAEQEVENLVPLLGGPLDTGLPPGSCDLILLADVYHELSHPVPVLASLRRALKPGGRLALLEFRAEDPTVPIKRLHKMDREQMDLELEANGFRRTGSYDELPWQHLCFYQVTPGKQE